MPSSMKSPIGIFDSGLGGISVLRAIREQMPGCLVAQLSESFSSIAFTNSPANFSSLQVIFLFFVQEFLTAKHAKNAKKNL